MATKSKLREIAADLDPLKLLEEMRAVQAYLAALADGEIPPPTTFEPPNLAAFVASLSTAWHAGEIRPTFSTEAKPLYLRSLQKVSTQAPTARPSAAPKLAIPPTTAAPPAKTSEKPRPVYAEPGQRRIQALRMAWPIACRRLEEFPNINAMQIFEELCIQFPGRFTRKQFKTFAQRVGVWRQAARARGVVIGPKTYRLLSDKPRGRRPDIFKDDWEEMAQCLEERPDQTALELLVEFQARYPGRYSLRQLYTLQKRVRAWRQLAVQRLIGEASSHISTAPHALVEPTGERRARLIAQPQPRQLEHRRSQPGIAGLRDALLVPDRSALPGCRRKPRIGGDLPAIVEVPEQLFRIRGWPHTQGT